MAAILSKDELRIIMVWSVSIHLLTKPSVSPVTDM